MHLKLHFHTRKNENEENSIVSAFKVEHPSLESKLMEQYTF